MKRLVFFVEGKGDEAAIPSLAARLLAEFPVDLQSQLFLDTNTFNVGSLEKFTGSQADKLSNWILAAAKRPQLGAILIAIEGDFDKFEGNAACVVEVARTLSERVRKVGAGIAFSLAIVFFRQEFESILISAGAQLPGLTENVQFPTAPEEAPRGAKKWLADNLVEKYSPTRDQLRLTQAIRELQPLRENNRCFLRFENALKQLCDAVGNDRHIVTPTAPTPPTAPTA